MIDSADFGTLSLLFRRANSLAPLPGTVLQLIREIDERCPSSNQLERIIQSDPALAANFYRLGALGEITPEGRKFGSTIASTITLLGHRAVRNIAVSLLTQGALRVDRDLCDFDPVACARHSLFVALFAQSLAGPREIEDLTEAIGNVFSAGLLHEVPLALLARISPANYKRVTSFAKRNSQSIVQSFETIYGNSIGVLGGLACEAWGLPPVFVRYQRHISEPWECEELYTDICRLQYADYAALHSDCRIETWDVDSSLSAEVISEINMSDQERSEEITRIQAAVDACYVPPADADPGRLVKSSVR